MTGRLVQGEDVPHYHFNVHDGRSHIDRDGIDLPDIQVARTEALQLAGGIIRDAAFRSDIGEEWHVEVTDASGLMLFRMDFVIAESPAAKGAAPSR